MVIAVNPGAGAGRADIAADLRARLPLAEVIELGDPGELEAVLDKAAARPEIRVLGVAGGDGTVSWASTVAAQHSMPLLVIPGGTLNHLAVDLGVDTVDEAVAALAAGQAVEIDLPRIDGHPFVNTASLGAYADLVDAREALEDRISKWPAAIAAAIWVLRRGTPIEVELDGEPRRLWMVFIGNGKYQPDGFAPARRDWLDDGMLDVRLIDAGPPYSRIRVVVGMLTGRLGRSPVYQQWSATSLRIRSATGPLRLARDGETFDGSSDVHVVKAADRLVVVSPIGS